MLGRIAAVNRTDMERLQQSRFSTVNSSFDRQAEALRVAGATEEEFADLEERRQKALANERRELPFFSANDRSRWNTIRALVEPEMRVGRTVTQPDGIARTETVWYAIDKVQNTFGWDTIDMVKHNNIAAETPLMEVLQQNGEEVVGQVTKLVERFPEYIEKVTNLIGKLSGGGQGGVKGDGEVEVIEPTEQPDAEQSDAEPEAKDVAEGEVAEDEAEERDEMAGYLYSSKPPLLPTLMAAPYALMYWAPEIKLSLESLEEKQFLQKFLLASLFWTSSEKPTLETDPHLIVRVTLIIFNLLPLVITWFLLSRLVERFGTTNWGRVFTVAFICFGTMISTFAITLNNHIPGVMSVTIAFYCAVRIVFDKETRWRYYILAGLFGAFAVACEKPALLFCGLIGLWLLWHQFVRTFFFFIPAALLVAAAFFAANYAAHQTLLPAYSQPDWYIYKYERGTNSDGTPRVLDSYWKNPQGLDKGEPSRRDYIFHSTIGHHGLYSLTPVWVLSLLGLLIWLFDRRYWGMALMILFTSVVVFAFYMGLKQELRNYGGNTSALRWVFWLAPLWSVALVAAADQFGKSIVTRGIALLCLIVSAMSVAYPVWNPWTMPWTYNLKEYVAPYIGW